MYQPRVLPAPHRLLPPPAFLTRMASNPCLAASALASGRAGNDPKSFSDTTRLLTSCKSSTLTADEGSLTTPNMTEKNSSGFLYFFSRTSAHNYEYSHLASFFLNQWLGRSGPLRNCVSQPDFTSPFHMKSQPDRATHCPSLTMSQLSPEMVRRTG